MAQVEFHFDFGSPNAYLAHLVIPEIERRTGAKFTYVPILLGGVFKMTEQPIAGGKHGGHQEQAGIRAAGNAALRRPPRHHRFRATRISRSTR